MKITFTQTGGFAPTDSPPCKLDTAGMPSAEARILEGLVATSGVLTDHNRNIAGASGAYFTFEIIDDTVTHRVTYHPSVPVSVRPLLDYLLEYLKKDEKDQLPQT